MKAEETLQYMADFYPNLIPTRKHALDFLFCTIGNGYKWIDGELVDEDDAYTKRYALKEEIQKAEFPCEMNWYLKSVQEQLLQIAGMDYDGSYLFKWSPLSTRSYIVNYPENITDDWKKLMEECRQMLIQDEMGKELESVLERKED